MARRRLSRIVFVGSALVGAGCSIITSFDAYTSGLGGSVSDAGFDAADASLDADASGEASVAVPSVDCTGSDFCDGFERAEVVGPWQQEFVADGSRLAIDPERVHGGKSSLRVSIGANLPAFGSLVKGFSPLSKFKLGYFFLLPGDGQRDRDFLQIRFVYADHQSVITFAISTTSFVVAEQEFALEAGTLTAQNLLAQVEAKRDRWIPVEFDIDNGATPPTISLTMDGETIFTRRTLGLNFGKTSVALVIGTTFTVAGPAVNFGVDDVRVDVVE